MGYFNLFILFSKIGLFGFGGGMAMLPFIFQGAQILTKMSEEEFSNLVVLSQITPGPLAINAATYVGFAYAGLVGALIATFSVSAPAFVLVLAVSKALDKNKESKLKEAVFNGIRPATAGLVAAASFIIAKGSLLASTFNLHLFSYHIVVFLASVVLAIRFKMSPIKIIGLVLLVSAVISYFV